MLSAGVPDFLPSRHGFRFANFFPPQPLFCISLPGLPGLPIGNAANGLCGGMVFAACDHFLAGVLPPPDVEPPGYDTPLFRYLVRRLFDSFHLPWGPVHYYRWMASAETPTGTGLARWTVRRAWPQVRQALEAGQLAPLGLIRVRSWNPLRLGQNHQVLAYRYELDEGTEELTLWVYEPNYPLRDDLTLSLGLRRPSGKGPIVSVTGETFRGFFTTPYRRCRSLPW